MKQIFWTLFIVIFLSGCAKVYEEEIPCTGVKPQTPMVDNVVVLSGSSVDVTPSFSPVGAIIKWAGPNNFKASGSYLHLDFNNSTNYGTYTATAYINGCPGDADSFVVAATYSGVPPCAVTTTNKLIGSSGISFQFAGACNAANIYCSGYAYDLSNAATSGYDFDLLTVDPPVPGSFYELGNDCGVYGNIAYVKFSSSTTTYYQSVSGRVYCTTVGTHHYMTFCGASFERVSTGVSFTLTGSIQMD